MPVNSAILASLLGKFPQANSPITIECMKTSPARRCLAIVAFGTFK